MNQMNALTVRGQGKLRAIISKIGICLPFDINTDTPSGVKVFGVIRKLWF